MAILSGKEHGKTRQQKHSNKGTMKKIDNEPRHKGQKKKNYWTRHHYLRVWVSLDESKVSMILVLSWRKVWVRVELQVHSVVW